MLESSIPRTDFVTLRTFHLPTKQIPDTLPKPQLEARPEMRADVIVIGAGPTGLACAIEAQKAGLKVISLDKGCLVNSIFHYPANMIFFTTPELLEIGDIPFSTANPKPNRLEALEYYRKVAERSEEHTSELQSPMYLVCRLLLE